jgi:ribosomal protein S27AE
MRPLDGYVWAFRFADGQAHQWTDPLTPDDEGIVTALCDVEATPSGLAEENRTGRCPTCGTTLALTDDEIHCVRCGGVWAAEDRPRLVIRFDGLRCFTCLLRSGFDFYARIPTPDPEEFRHAVRNMNTDGPADPDDD